ncbi:MAG: hypothetical protein WB524_12670 [Acidobacteriaceae bacterium]
MRLVIWLAVPVGLLLLLASVTVILEMATGAGYCGTWLSILTPDCGQRIAPTPGGIVKPPGRHSSGIAI